jgi:hypothetical protein
VAVAEEDNLIPDINISTKLLKKWPTSKVNKISFKKFKK